MNELKINATNKTTNKSNISELKLENQTATVCLVWEQ